MKRILFSTLLYLFITSLYAQVGIGTTNPDASSILDIESSNAGVLIPRVSLTNTTIAAPITSPAESLLIYNTNTVGDVLPGFYYWTGSAWKALASSGSGTGNGGWGLRGNVVSDDDFLGTLLNYKPLKFRVDNIPFGHFHPQGAISLGYGAVANNDNAVAIGTSSNAGTSNSVAIGTSASTSTSNLSVAIGPNASVTNHLSTAMGNLALASGHSALALGTGSIASAEGSSAVGRESIASGQYSTAIGYGATVNQTNTIRLGNDNAKIGIGTSTPHVSSIVEISSSNKGLLIPRVGLTSTSDQSTITQLAESLLVYNTSTTGDITPGFYFWTGTAWQALGGSSGGGGANGNSYGERFLDTDVVVALNQYTNVAAPSGVANSLTTSDIAITGAGLTLGNTGGVYKVTLTVTYSKQTANADVNEVEFYITKHGTKISNTSIRGDLNDDLKRNTVTMTKILELDAWGTYHFGISATGPPGAVISPPSIILHKDSTNLTIERLD